MINKIAINRVIRVIKNKYLGKYLIFLSKIKYICLTSLKYFKPFFLPCK